MSRLPTPGQDNGTWGAILNDYLSQSHASDGTLKAGSVGASQVQDGALPKTKLDTTTQASLTKADGSLQASNNLSDVTATTARTNLGLGTAATMTPATLAADSAFSGTYAAKGSLAINVKDYGAVGDGVASDRVAIQNAINAANALYISTGVQQDVIIPKGIFKVGAVNYIKGDGSTYGITSLVLLDGVHIKGSGTIKLGDGSYGSGAFYRLFSSHDGTGSGGDVRLSNASISDITIDGNAANHPASTQCSNIVLECLANVTVKNVRSINCNGNGIMLRGTTTTNATNLKILNNTVLNSSSIGIQSSQFDGLVISDNYVDTSADNNIDIYGEDGTTTCHGKNFVISNNICKNGLVGIFPETVRDGVISGNMISGCVSAGIHVNRINGAPRGINILGNTITSCPVSMFVTGDTNGVKVSGNYFRDFTTTGVSLGGAGGGNVSGVYITDNYFDPHDTTTYCITTAGSVSSVNRAVGNTMPSTISSAYWINETALTSVSCYYEVPAVGNHPQITAASIGLGLVDNTSDLAKPVSNAQQAALDLKLDINATAHLNSATNPAPASITGWVSSNPGALPLIYTTASGYGEIRAQRFASGGTGILLCSLTSCGVVGTQVLPAGTHWQFSVDVKPPVDAHTNAGGAFPGGIALAAGVYTRITGTLVGTGAATNPTTLIVEANVDPGVTNVFTYLRHALLVQAPQTPTISYFDGDSAGASWTGTPNASSSLGAGVLIGVDPSSPQTLSNKRITPRVSTIASSATPGPTSDTTDLFTVTALATGATFAAPTGTPSDGQLLFIRIKDNGSAQSLAWNAIYRAGSTLLPSTTIVGKQHYLEFVYCAMDTKWDLIMAVTAG